MQQHPSDEIRVAIHSGQVPRLDEAVELPSADLHVWAESACRADWTRSQWLDFRQRIGGTIVSGLIHEECNSAIVVGDSVQFFHKHFLVMGTEQRTPFGLGAGFRAGPPPQPARIAVPICYEITLPQAIVGRPEIIVNPASEATIADIGKQMTLAHARLRAIETRRPVVRSVEAGYSGTIDGNGRMGPIGHDNRWSLYSVAGDWLLGACATAQGGYLLVSWLRRRSRLTNPRTAVFPAPTTRPDNLGPVRAAHNGSSIC